MPVHVISPLWADRALKGQVRVAGPKLGGPQLHLGGLVAVVVSLPRLPVDAICVALVGPPEVATVQVRHVTTSVPPGPLVQHRAACRVLVIVPVFGGEELVFVSCQGISCLG